MDRRRLDLTAGGILLLGGWLFYLAFIGANAAFYGLGYATMVCVVVPVALICSTFPYRRPFRAALFIAFLTRAAKSVLERSEIALRADRPRDNQPVDEAARSANAAPPQHIQPECPWRLQELSPPAKASTGEAPSPCGSAA